MKKAPKTRSSSDPSQLDKFKEAARELECDDSAVHFKEKLAKLIQKKKAEKE